VSLIRRERSASETKRLCVQRSTVRTGTPSSIRGAYLQVETAETTASSNRKSSSVDGRTSTTRAASTLPSSSTSTSIVTSGTTSTAAAWAGNRGVGLYSSTAGRSSSPGAGPPAASQASSSAEAGSARHRAL
jgi:hypothetical protein